MPVPLTWGCSVVTFGGSRCYVVGIHLNEHTNEIPFGECPSLSCFDVSKNCWNTLPSPSLRVKKSFACFPFPSISTFRGSVLGYSVQSIGSDADVWFSSELYQHDDQ